MARPDVGTTVEIEFCRQCRYHMRAAWWAAELFNQYAGKIARIELVDGETSAFEIRLNGALVYSKLKTGEFPDLEELKQTLGQKIIQLAGERVSKG
jgi:selenoprotein W-related protein